MKRKIKKCKLKYTNREKLIAKCLLSDKEDISDNLTMEIHERILSLSKELKIRINELSIRLSWQQEHGGAICWDD